MNRLINKEVKWLYQIANKKKRYVGVLIFIQTLLSVSGIVYALLMRGAIDGAVAHKKPVFFGYFGLMIGLVVLQIALRALDRYMEEYLRTRMENAFKKRLFGQLLRKNFGDVTEVHSGEWMNRLTSDASVCASGIVDILPKLIGLLVKLLAAFGMIVVIEPLFAWLLIPAGLILILFTSVFRKVLKRMHREMQEKDGRVRVFLQEHLSSLLILKAFSAEKQSEEEAAEKMQDYKAARMRRSNFSNVCNIGFAALMNAVYLLGGVGYCGYGILTGTISYGTFTAMLQLIGQIQSPFANISGFLPKYYAMLASAERLMEAELFEEDVLEEVKSIEQVQAYYEKDFAEISMEQVSFAYSMSGEGEEIPIVLQDLSMKVKKGDCVALTGHSGCGKSTTLKLLLALYPLDSGNCTLVSKSNCETLDGRWRRLFAYVPQGNYLMCGTIRELVAFADKSLMQDEDRLHRALEIACASEFVDELEMGVDTELGEKGHGLSEGQMQRLAIARAVFADSPILLLDEATSALDEDTECKLLENLKHMTNKTVLIVTHRMRALEICNKVAHFTEDGVTVEQA
ncbi:MAG: ABC transporter ATP-binding protein [Faecalimonas sp.]|nr:ABC transporter ATP-binding protein [Faecalimonas sp.]